MPSLPALDRDRLVALLPTGVVLFLLAGLAWQLARITWLVAAPPSPIGVPSPAPEARASFADAFHPDGGAEATGSTDTVSGYRLLGVRAGMNGPDSASAILAGPDGHQQAYRVGETIAGGATLQAVAADHVVIVANGRGSKLAMSRAPAQPAAARAPAPATRAPPAASPPPAGTAGDGIAPAELMSAAGMRANVEGGYTLTPRGDGALFRRAGLRAGDILTAIDGQPIDLERLRALEGELGERTTTRLTVRRGNETRTVVLQAETP